MLRAKYRRRALRSRSAECNAPSGVKRGLECKTGLRCRVQRARGLVQGDPSRRRWQRVQRVQRAQRAQRVRPMGNSVSGRVQWPGRVRLSEEGTVGRIGMNGIGNGEGGLRLIALAHALAPALALQWSRLACYDHWRAEGQGCQAGQACQARQAWHDCVPPLAAFPIRGMASAHRVGHTCMRYRPLP